MPIKNAIFRASFVCRRAMLKDGRSKSTDPLNCSTRCGRLRRRAILARGNEQKKRARRIFLQPWIENYLLVARRLEAVQRSEGY